MRHLDVDLMEAGYHFLAEKTTWSSIKQRAKSAWDVKITSLSARNGQRAFLMAPQS